MKKNEMIIFSIIFFISLTGCIVFMILGKNSSYVSISVDGTYKCRYSLKQDKEVTIEDGNGGWNTIVIEDGQVYVKSANCPHQDCMMQGSISHNNESIICLPHRMTITITNPKEEAFDEEAR